MKTVVKVLLLLCVLALAPLSSQAQCTNAADVCVPTVPHFVKFNGMLRNAAGAPPSEIVTIKFIIYGESTGGTPLWHEVQNVLLDQQGYYEVLLGVTGSEGIPADLFTSGEPRWVGVQALLPGREEEPRVMLVSVPYALQAENAKTLGGLPASAFAKAAPNSAVLNTSPPVPDATSVNGAALNVAGGSVLANTSSSGLSTSQGVTTPGGTANTVAKFSTAASIVNSQITEQNGVVSMENLANILFADQFSGGVPAAVAACPAKGCVIYAVSPNVNLTLGNIDPGSKAITIYLGPYTYTIKQVMLRNGLKIIGMGASKTSLQSVNGNSPVFVIPQTNNEPATNVLLSGFQLYGSAGNTSEDGFFLDTSSTVNTGLWFSTFDDISLQGFAGIGIHAKGRNDNFGAGSQWVRFNHVIVWRTPGGGNALRLEGAVFELRFTNCLFEGQGMGDGTNIYIGGLAGGVNGYPLTIVFEGLVSQNANLAVQIDGGVNIAFHGSHHEQLCGAYQITGVSNIGTRGLTISDSYFAGNVGINGGAGYVLNVATQNASGIFFVHNRIFGVADSVVKGTNFASVVYQDNLYCEICAGPPTSGITTQVSPATSINILGAHSIGLNPSTTPITTIQSELGPGEMVTFFTFAGPATFAAGGNIDLMGMNSLTVNGTITFVRTDLGGMLWKPVSQWSPGRVVPAVAASLKN
jgi:hypothetical protein